MSAHDWVVLVTFLVVQAFAFGGLLAVTRHRVEELEKAALKQSEALALLAQAAARTETVAREDQKILTEIDKLEKEIREGFVYFGECLGALTMLVNAHDSWLASMEKTTGSSRPRMPQTRPAPHPPGWLPPRAQVPPAAAGTARPVHDPRRDPSDR